jgi:hypothetical protein
MQKPAPDDAIVIRPPEKKPSSCASRESASSADSGSAVTASPCGLRVLFRRVRSLRMSSHVPTHDRRAAITSGEFMPLTVEEFRNGYATFSDGLDGKLPRDPDFPAEYHDAVTGAGRPVEDTPFNRAWIAADKKYGKYVDREAGSFHIALLAAVAAVRFSFRTTPKALRAAFDADFRRRLAAAVDPGDSDKPQ